MHVSLSLVLHSDLNFFIFSGKAAKSGDNWNRFSVCILVLQNIQSCVLRRLRETLRLLLRFPASSSGITVLLLDENCIWINAFGHFRRFCQISLPVWVVLPHVTILIHYNLMLGQMDELVVVERFILVEIKFTTLWQLTSWTLAFLAIHGILFLLCPLDFQGLLVIHLLLEKAHRYSSSWPDYVFINDFAVFALLS